MIGMNTALKSDSARRDGVPDWIDRAKLMVWNSTDASQQVSCSKPLEPPKPRGDKGLIGMKNLGQTCHMNSLLTSLAYTPEFKERICAIKPHELRHLSGDKRNFIEEFQKAFVHLHKVDTQCYIPQRFTESVGWSARDLETQKDVHEDFTLFNDKLTEALKDTSDAKLVDDLFKGQEGVVTTCKECGYQGKRTTDFFSVMMPTFDENSVESALDGYFKSEVMEGDSKYECPECDSKQDAERVTTLEKTPKILVLMLNRVGFSGYGGVKHGAELKYSTSLDVAKHVPDSTGECTDYELQSSIIHHGNGANNGHYYSIVKDTDKIGKAEVLEHEELPPRERSSSVTSQQSSSSSESGSSATANHRDINDPHELIQAVMLENAACQAVTLQQLTDWITKGAGRTWAKKFKKSHGPLTKFLVDKCVDIVHYDDSTQTIRNIDHSDVILPSTINEHGDGLHNELTKEVYKRAEWYKMDDSNVSAVSSKDLQYFMDGKKSAYILIYRRKDLKRPIEAVGNANYGLTVAQLKDAEQMNEGLTKMRRDYDIHMNKIQVEIYTSELCKVDDGSLKTTAKHGNYLSIDKRLKVADLMGAVRSKIRLQQQHSPPKPKPKMMRLETDDDVSKSDEDDVTAVVDQITTVHVVKVTANKQVKLLKQIDDVSMSLEQGGVEDNMQIFVWNGTTVSGVKYSYDPNNKQIKLTSIINRNYHREEVVTIEDFNQSIYDVIHDKLIKLSKSSKSSNITTERDRVIRDDTTGKVVQKSRKKMTKQDLDATCSTLKDGDTFVASHSRPSSPNIKDRLAENNDNMVSISVVNNLQLNTDSDEEVVEKFTVPKAWTVGKLTDVIKKAFELSKKMFGDGGVDKTFRLQVVDKYVGLNLPLLEDDLLSNHQLQGQTIRFDIGDKMASDEMIIFLRTEKDRLVCRPVVIKKTIMMNELFDQVLEQLQWEGKEWNIRKINCYGDVITTFEDCTENKSIEEVGLRHGDFISVAAGKFLAKGYIRAKVWLGPEPLKLNDITAEQWAKLKNNQRIETHYLHLNEPDDPTAEVFPEVPTEPIYLGSFDVNRNSKIFDFTSKARSLIPESYNLQTWSKMVAIKKGTRNVQQSTEKADDDKKEKKSDLCMRLWTEEEGFGTIISYSMDEQFVRKHVNDEHVILVLYPRQLEEKLQKTVKVHLHTNAGADGEAPGTETPPEEEHQQRQYFDLCQHSQFKMNVQNVVYLNLYRHLTSISDVINVSLGSPDDNSRSTMTSPVCDVTGAEQEDSTSRNQAAGKKAGGGKNNIRKKNSKKGNKKGKPKPKTQKTADTSSKPCKSWNQLNENDNLEVELAMSLLSL